MLSEYEFRSWHSASHTSSSEVVPLNNVRMTRSHLTLPSRSSSVKISFRSPSLSPNSVRLTLFCAVASDEATTYTRILNSRRIIVPFPWELCGDDESADEHTDRCQLAFSGGTRCVHSGTELSRRSSGSLLHWCPEPLGRASLPTRCSAWSTLPNPIRRRRCSRRLRKHRTSQFKI